MTRAELIARWVAAGCPHDEFLQHDFENGGCLAELGLPKWASWYGLFLRRDEGKGKRNRR